MPLAGMFLLASHSLYYPPGSVCRYLPRPINLMLTLMPCGSHYIEQDSRPIFPDLFPLDPIRADYGTPPPCLAGKVVGGPHDSPSKPRQACLALEPSLFLHRFPSIWLPYYNRGRAPRRVPIIRRLSGLEHDQVRARSSGFAFLTLGFPYLPCAWGPRKSAMAGSFTMRSAFQQVERLVARFGLAYLKPSAKRCPGEPTTRTLRRLDALRRVAELLGRATHQPRLSVLTTSPALGARAASPRAS